MCGCCVGSSGQISLQPVIEKNQALWSPACCTHSTACVWVCVCVCVSVCKYERGRETEIGKTQWSWLSSLTGRWGLLCKLNAWPDPIKVKQASCNVREDLARDTSGKSATSGCTSLHPLSTLNPVERGAQSANTHNLYWAYCIRFHLMGSGNSNMLAPHPTPWETGELGDTGPISQPQGVFSGRLTGCQMEIARPFLSMAYFHSNISLFEVALYWQCLI